MRIIQLFLALLLLSGLATHPGFAAAGGPTSVRAILFVASNQRGTPDPKLRSYEPVLRSNLRFESYRYMGEGAAAVAPGATATLTLPGGNRVELERDKSSGPVKVHRGGAIVSISPGKPVVLMGGASGNKGDVFGIIVLAN